MHCPSLAALVVSAAFPWLAADVLAHDPTAAVAPAAVAVPGANLAGRDWNMRQTPIVDVVKRVRTAVVNIHSERTVLGPASEELLTVAPTQSRINGMGTGIIIDPRGYIITNQHVVDEVSLLRVRLADGTTASAARRGP